MTGSGAGQPVRRDLFPPAAAAAMLAFAGLPVYIHVPRFYAEEMSVSLALLGIVLLAARAVDSFQDPLLGRLSDRWSGRRELWALVSGLVLAVGIALLFAPPGWGEPVPRLVIGLLAAFTGFSALQIALYDHGLAQAETAGGGYTQIALWREAGALVGVCLAAAAPAMFVSAVGGAASYSGYAAVFVLFSVFALGWMRGRWLASGDAFSDIGFSAALRVPGVVPLLVFGFVNALPTAVTSTLFLFFVTDVLAAEQHAGLMLIVFFAAAALAAPAWARLADHIGRKTALAAGMTLSVPVFIWAWTLGPGDAASFYLIAAGSGAAVGADMILAPAMLAARIRGGGPRVFSLWTFLQKSALAVAAGVTLPALALAGYEPGTSSLEGRAGLSAAYALVPCALKLAAIPVLLMFVADDGDGQ